MTQAHYEVMVAVGAFESVRGRLSAVQPSAHKIVGDLPKQGGFRVEGPRNYESRLFVPGVVAVKPASGPQCAI